VLLVAFKFAGLCHTHLTSELSGSSNREAIGLSA
jgi:hypothetical protein